MPSPTSSSIVVAFATNLRMLTLQSTSPRYCRAVATADDVREIALRLEGAVENDSDGFDFRVGGKGFVWSYPKRVPGQKRVLRLDVAVLFVGDEAEKVALLLGEPELFFTAPGYDGWPLVMVRLELLDRARLEELVTDAWSMRRGAGST